MNDTINFKCPVCGAFLLMLETGKRLGDNTYCAICSVEDMQKIVDANEKIVKELKE